MAKTKHNKLLDTIDTLINDAKDEGLVHLYTGSEEFRGRKISINGKELFHFGTTGYLGLEQDNRLKKAAIEAIIKYGTQFPLSKTYLSFGMYQELEENLYKIFGYPIVVTKNSTLGHQAVIPNVVKDEDVVILDQQVHASVQSAAQFLKPRGIKVDLIRHNDMEDLENRIKDYQNKYNQIWYMADGVYSMYGDKVPIHNLVSLMKKYDNFNVYVDDVHGMSWTGKNGSGHIMNELGKLPDKMILVSTLSKSFGASGGVIIFSSDDYYQRVKTFGGPLTFSAQLEPSAIAAAIASSKIHLSDEIYEKQNLLAEKIEYCNDLIEKAGLPLIQRNSCPVFFIGTGIPGVGYKFANRLFKDGYYVNIATFPVVPIKKTGIRFTISLHNEKEEIKGLVESMEKHYQPSLETENFTENEVRKLFNLNPAKSDKQSKHSDLKIEIFKSINEFSKSEWNNYLGNKEFFDWEGLKFLEDVFSGNEKPEHNWDFFYFVIKDKKGKVILQTFFTKTLCKEDILAPYKVSEKIEKERQANPYYLTSQILMLGSVFTEGDHLYFDHKHPQASDAMEFFIKEVSKIQEDYDIQTTFLRDFNPDNEYLKNTFLKKGFFKVDVPESCIINNMEWSNLEEYKQILSYKSRRNLKKDILNYEDYFTVEIKEKAGKKEIEHFKNLFYNVKNNNLDINLFDFPDKFFDKISENPEWEFIILKLNTGQESHPIVSVMFSYVNEHKVYCPMYIGMDYNYLKEYKIYKQALFQTVKRAKALKCKKINFGISSSFEKKKLGADIIAKEAYVQAKDNFNLELIESMNVKEES